MYRLVNYMSRIGTTPVVAPKDVTVTVSNGLVTVAGVKGQIIFGLPAGVTVEHEAEGVWNVKLKKGGDTALHGFIRAQFANAVTGVSKEWFRTLELAAVGYRAAMSGENLVLTVGFSHPVTVTPPQGITIAVSEGKIIVSGVDKQIVGQVAANIRAIKKPEPYKGKGIKYEGEYIRKKAGKAAKAVGAAVGGAK